MEEQVFYDDKQNRIRGNIGETLKPLHYSRHYVKQTMDPLIVRKIYLTRNPMILMSHQCFPPDSILFIILKHLFFHMTYIHCPHTIADIFIS